MKLQSPLPSAVVVPTDTPSRKISTEVFAAAVPLRVGVVSLVMVSPAEPELSLKPVITGAAGAVVSITMICEPE